MHTSTHGERVLCVMTTMMITLRVWEMLLCLPIHSHRGIDFHVLFYVFLSICSSAAAASGEKFYTQ